MKENQDCNLQSVYQQIVEISKKYQVKKSSIIWITCAWN